MSRLKYTFLKFGIGALRAVYAVLKLLPVQKKYLFMTKLSSDAPWDFELLAESLRRRHPDHRIVMLCRPMDAGYPLHLFVQMYHLATSEAVFLDRSNMAIHILDHRDSLCVIQLWHALGSMKKFGYSILDTPEGQPRELARIMRMHHGYTWILISSMGFISDYLEGFGTDGSNVVQIPLPRADALTSAEYRAAKREEIIRAYPELSGESLVLYCPTYRKVHAPDAERRVQELVDAVCSLGKKPVYSPHPLSSLEISDPRVARCEGLTSQDLLFVADAVVTDYSSIMYEAGLVGVPVYLYAYDWDDYRKNRSHNLDLRAEVPAAFCETASQLAEAMEAGECCQVEFQRFVERNVVMPQGSSCCDAIVDLVDRTRQSRAD